VHIGIHYDGNSIELQAIELSCVCVCVRVCLCVCMRGCVCCGGMYVIISFRLPNWEDMDALDLINKLTSGIYTTTEQAFGHLPKMNNNLGPISVRDKNIISPGW